MNYAQRLDEARQLMHSICAGLITPELHPSYFEEDTVCFSVWALEEADPEWLLSMIADDQFSVRDRMNVVNNMNRLRSQAVGIVGCGKSGIRPQLPDVG